MTEEDKKKLSAELDSSDRFDDFDKAIIKWCYGFYDSPSDKTAGFQGLIGEIGVNWMKEDDLNILGGIG